MVNDKTKEYLILAGAGLGILIVAMMLLRGGGNASGTVAGPSSAELNSFTQLAEQSNALAEQHSQDALAAITQYENTKANLELGLQQIQANVSINATNAQSAEMIAQYQMDAAQAVAQLQEQAAVAVAQSQQQAAQYAAAQQSAAAQAQAHASQQNGLWGSIANIVTGVLSFFNPVSGINQPAPVQVPSTPGVVWA